MHELSEDVSSAKARCGMQGVQFIKSRNSPWSLPVVFSAVRASESAFKT